MCTMWNPHESGESRESAGGTRLKTRWEAFNECVQANGAVGTRNVLLATPAEVCTLQNATRAEAGLV